MKALCCGFNRSTQQQLHTLKGGLHSTSEFPELLRDLSAGGYPTYPPGLGFVWVPEKISDILPDPQAQD